MMTRFVLTALLPALLICGCADGTATTDTPVGDSQGDSQPMTDDSLGTPTASLDSTSDKTGAGTAKKGGGLALNPNNTTITFVGVHVGDKPDPRTGRFDAFTGNATVSDGELSSLKVDIDTASIKTDIDKLTDHLKGPDFFDVRENPKASFESTKIETAADGTATVTGNLTLLNTTKEISFPATVTTDGGLQLEAKFSIDRSEFGMNYGPDKIENNVEMTVTIGG